MKDINLRKMLNSGKDKRDVIAKLLRASPERLKEFERAYAESSLDTIDDNFFNILTKVNENWIPEL